jgi:hypothetical protein
MRRSLSLPGALFGALLLAACTPAYRADEAAFRGPDDAAHRECRAEAERSPDVVVAGRQAFLGNPAQQERTEAGRQEAVGRAYQDCLRRRGLIRGGGVEPVRRPSMF